MKILSVNVLNDGLSEYDADRVWDETEANANYQFNKSHATAYSLISYWTMWLRVRYPAEYFAACMSVVKDDKLPGLVSDARDCGIEVLPPDINLSTEKFTIPDDAHILAPFSAVKGISENTAMRIVELRQGNKSWKTIKVKKSGEEVWGMDETSPTKGFFSTPDEFILAAGQTGSRVNSSVVEALKVVGAFAAIDKDELPARHMDRRKAQTELMPGLIIDTIKSGRVTDTSEKFLRAKVISLIQEYKRCEGCSLKGAPHPSIRVNANVKFMVVCDYPTWQEEKKDRLMEGDAADYVKLAIKEMGLSVSNGYYTTLVKSKKSEKMLTNEQINGCSKFIEREVELVKPSVIVALGSASVKYFLPGLKMSPTEMAGKVVYVPERDAQVVCGISPASVAFDPSKFDILAETFRKVSEIVT